MRTLPRFVPLQFVFGLLSLSTISFSLPTYANSVAYETETAETAMSFEFGDNIARMNAGEDNYFLLSGNEQYMVSRSEDGWQVLEIGSMTKALVSFAAQYAEQMPGASESGESTGRYQRGPAIKVVMASCDRPCSREPNVMAGVSAGSTCRLYTPRPEAYR